MVFRWDAVCPQSLELIPRKKDTGEKDIEHSFKLASDCGHPPLSPEASVVFQLWSWKCVYKTLLCRLLFYRGESLHLVVPRLTFSWVSYAASFSFSLATFQLSPEPGGCGSGKLKSKRALPLPLCLLLM